MTDLESVTPNGCRVFSTFACGGGSTMGYKLAGYEVVGANDIDPEMAEVYQANHKPKHYYLKPIGQLVEQLRKEGLPEHLQGLDILDGSPPCSSFSMAGKREKNWGTKKKFREGQAAQILDDLFFDYLDLVELVQPSVFVAENVSGILKGNAKGYSKSIVLKAQSLGYFVQVIQTNATLCGVPQSRERVFFVGSKTAQCKLKFKPMRQPIDFATACKGLQFDRIDIEAAWLPDHLVERKCWEKTKPGKTLSTVHPTGSMFNNTRLSETRPAPTITASAKQLHSKVPRRLIWSELLRIGSFPDDYNLCCPKRKKWNEKAQYLVGMSVPPFMIRDLSAAIYEQWLA